MAEEKNHLIFAIMQFFEKELMRSDISPDDKESLEVSIQCLENVYGVFASDPMVKAKYPMPAPLQEIFETGLGIKKETYKPNEVSSEDKAKADKHKANGNELMKSENFSGAIDEYTKAIEFDDQNAVYFCNRAAAYSKSNDHKKAIEDCHKALQIDPKYSKAYGRLGLAYSAINQFGDAKLSFERALELDPANESYKTNLEVAEQKLADQSRGPGGMFPGMPGMPGFGPGMADMGGFAQMLNNPALINMATQMMSNPQMQQMMANFMGSMRSGDESGSPPDMAEIMQVGQQFAQQLSSQNPELVEQLRTAMPSGGVPPGGADADQPPSDQKPSEPGNDS